MKLLTAALVASLSLARHVLATAAPVALSPLFRSRLDVEHLLRRDADLVPTIVRRQEANPADAAPKASSASASASPVASTSANATASIDVSQADSAEWEPQTQSACDDALQRLNGVASNPSGIAVCYNLPFLDVKTGVFQAELRLYNISTPRDPWLGVSSDNMTLKLSFPSATVQQMDVLAPRDLTWSPIVKRQADNQPQEIKALMYAGKIKADAMANATDRQSLRSFLTPRIELNARSPNGEDVSTTVSTEGSNFVNGIYAKRVTADPVDAQAQDAAPEDAPFVLPGTSLAFFPVGLVITLVWTILFVGAVGFGTVGRIQFRDQYRRRIKNDAARSVRTI